jgi:Ca-activated chloride channel family protein
MRYITALFIILTIFVVIKMSNTVLAYQIKLDTSLATPALLAEQKQKVYLRVSLTGLPLQQQKRVPINVALVIDKSGSMQGEKITNAKKAAIMAVEHLRPDDIISVITYDHQAEILLPATKASDKEFIIQNINNLKAGGSTALYDGMEKAAKEIRKFLDRKRVNRIVLVSDGLANVGPSTPEELGKLGAALGEENISVTTIGLGLGYNEDLMTQLAKKSDGNHAFVEEASDLLAFFEHEFSDILSVVSQEVNVTIICGEGIRPLRVLGRDAKILAQQVFVKLNQLYSEQEKYILLELEVSAHKAGEELMIAGIAVVYRRMDNDKMERMSNMARASFTDSFEIVAEKTNVSVMTAVAEQLAVEKNELAVKLRDEGKIKEAQRVLIENANKLGEEAAKYNSKSLEKLKEMNLDDAKNLEGNKWVKQRKLMRKKQYKSKTQQKY